MVPVARTDIPVDSDELLGALDADTRDYLSTLISAAGIGLKDRGPDLKALFRALRPTFHQVNRINSELAGREHDVAKLVHNIEELSGAVRRRVAAAARRSSAEQPRRCGRAPPTTARSAPASRCCRRRIRASRTTFKSTRALIDELRPTLRALTPAHGEVAARADARAARPRPVDPARARPAAAAHREAQPLAVRLRPTVRRLTDVTPSLTRAFAALHYFTNELVYDPGNERGYLFWLAWLGHNTASATSTDDALGTIDRGLTLVSCDSIAQPGKGNDVVALVGALARSACPKEGHRLIAC